MANKRLWFVVGKVVVAVVVVVDDLSVKVADDIIKWASFITLIVILILIF
jgi:hypothetical protein